MSWNYKPDLLITGKRLLVINDLCTIQVVHILVLMTQDRSNDAQALSLYCRLNHMQALSCLACVMHV